MTMRKSVSLTPSHGATPAAVAMLTIFLVAVAVAVAFAADTTIRVLPEKTVRVRTPALPSGLAAKSAIVVDATTGQTLYSRNASNVRLIASTTKIMTALVAISRTQPTQMIPATAYRSSPGESLAGLKSGEKLSAQDLLKALLLESANDAADTFAARTASSRGAFVGLMNQRARALGLSRTHYGNAVGFDVPRTVSTAQDLAKLATAAMKVPRFKAIVGRAKATLTTGSIVRHIVNRNDLVRSYSFVDGIKTGHTTRAGYLLVGAAHKQDREVISVVMGEPSVLARNHDSMQLLRYGRGLFKVVHPANARRVLTTLPIALQDADASVYPTRTLSYALKNAQRYGVSLSAPKELDGPIAAGSRVGTAIVSIDGSTVATVPVVVRKAVAKPPIQAVMLHDLERLLPLIALLVIAFMIVLLLTRRRHMREATQPQRASTSTNRGERSEIRETIS